MTSKCSKLLSDSASCLLFHLSFEHFDVISINPRLEFLFESTEFTSHSENKLVICLNSNLLCAYTFHWSIYSSIYFPRNIGMGVSSASARIGSMSAPYIVWLVLIFMFVHWCCGRPEESAILICRAQLFEGRFALKPGLNWTLVSLTCVQKYFRG